MRYAVLALAILTSACPVVAQEVSGGRVATSSVGQAGQRQYRSSMVGGALERNSSRIQNRVQSRIRNRIDRNYNPQANSVLPFAVADEQDRFTGRSIKR